LGPLPDTDESILQEIDDDVVDDLVEVNNNLI